MEDETLVNIPTPPIVRGASYDKHVLEHKFKVQDDRYNNRWYSCCFVLDRRAIQYFTQVFIIVGIMAFCIVQLYHLHSCEGQQAYLGLLTMSMGILIPSPKFSNKN